MPGSYRQPARPLTDAERARLARQAETGRRRRAKWRKVGEDTPPPSETERQAAQVARIAEPEWDNASPQQIQTVYTSAGLALYNYLKWGVNELLEEGPEAFPGLDLEALRNDLRTNYYAARAHWRRGDKTIAARLMWRSARLAFEGHERLMELARQTPSIMRFLNRTGARGYAERLGEVLNAVGRGAETIATAAGAGFGAVLLLGALVLLGGSMGKGKK